MTFGYGYMGAYGFARGFADGLWAVLAARSGYCPRTYYASSYNYSPCFGMGYYQPPMPYYDYSAYSIFSANSCYYPQYSYSLDYYAYAPSYDLGSYSTYSQYDYSGYQSNNYADSYSISSERAYSVKNTKKISSKGKYSGNTDKESIMALISELSEKYGVDERLINAIVEQESDYNPHAKSHKGAKGLMQLMPATAAEYGVKNPYDPYENLDGGIRLFSKLLKQYNGDISLALAAYNAGSGNVKKYGGIPPFKETQNYVRKIMANYNKKLAEDKK